LLDILPEIGTPKNEIEQLLLLRRQEQLDERLKQLAKPVVNQNPLDMAKQMDNFLNKMLKPPKALPTSSYAN